MQTFWTTPSGVYWPERISRLDLNIVTDDNDNEAQRAAAGVSTVTVKAGRVYDQATDQDGNRVLVDRLWPRGMSKSRADIGEWCKQVAPSTALPAKTRSSARPQSSPNYSRNGHSDRTVDAWLFPPGSRETPTAA
jgi:hypothetical protein